MTPKLGLLAQRLNRGVPSTETVEHATSHMLTSYKEECDRQSKLAVKLVEDKLAAAQSEIASLKAQLTEASKDNNRGVKDYGYKVDSLKESHKQEIDALCRKHYDQAGQIHEQLESAKRECALECQAKVRAETELEGTKKMIARLEQTVASLQNEVKAKPVVSSATDKKPMPMKLRVTQRDESGRIVEMSMT